jgi:hypothetical protein
MNKLKSIVILGTLLFTGMIVVEASEKSKVVKPKGEEVKRDLVRFTVVVPDTRWSMKVSEAYAKDEILYIVCDMIRSDGDGLTALQNLKGEAKLPSKYAKLKPQILLRGAEWNWQQDYKRVTTKELKLIIKGANKVELQK